MGSSQSVDFKDFETRKEIKEHVDRLSEKSDELKKEVENVSTNSSRLIGTKMENVFARFSEAECECSAPKFVFWLSESKRHRCMDARRRSYASLAELVDAGYQAYQTAEVSDRMMQHAKMMADTSSLNRKYTAEKGSE